MKVPYVCCSKKFEEPYTNQSGSGIPHYEGVSFQTGYGLGVDMKIKLIRSKPEFYLQGDAGHKVALEKINLLVRKERVSPGVILGHEKALVVRKRLKL
ncbi:hypothetical protein CDAR_620681 [Caerostris darwini]|uniref:Uncharacterized protein n=1 Tax=Caerostris darwini TaxID=1538125 RepID=A0AAV4NJG5_9ARAC|nr:hypothetical protein CDAR_620681 [Caerostris darwini]